MDLLVLTPREFGWARVYDPVVRTALLEGVVLCGSLEAAGPARWSGVDEDDDEPRDRELPDIKELDAGIWIARARKTSRPVG